MALRMTVNGAASVPRPYPSGDVTIRDHDLRLRAIVCIH
jgi:hypothetical protein